MYINTKNVPERVPLFKKSTGMSFLHVLAPTTTNIARWRQFLLLCKNYMLNMCFENNRKTEQKNKQIKFAITISIRNCSVGYLIRLHVVKIHKVFTNHLAFWLLRI